MNSTEKTSIPEVREYFFVSAQREKQELLALGRQIADLSIGNPDLPPPAEVLEKLISTISLAGVHGYQSNAGAEPFRQSVARWYDRFFGVAVNPHTEILPLQGSRQGILQLSQALLKPGDKVLVPDPGYPSYAFGARMMGATTISYPLSVAYNFLPDWQQMERQNLEGVKIMWLNYPHMPTGARGSEQMFEEAIAFARKHKMLVVNDHAYAFIRNNTPLSILSAAGAHDVALELNSLSKNYHLAGWRLGFLAGNATILSQVSKLKSHLDSGIALPLQLAAARALDLGYSWFAPQSNIYNARAAMAKTLAHAMGCIPCGGEHGMFLWVSMPQNGLSSSDFARMLLHGAGVLVAPGSLFGPVGEGHLRISLCAPREQFALAIENIRNSEFSHQKLN